MERRAAGRLVGRERELALLVDTSVRGTYLYGPAGIGKSALLREAAAAITATDPDTTLLIARCSAAEESTPFAILHQLVTPVLDTLDRLEPGDAEVVRTTFRDRDGGSPSPLARGMAFVRLFTLLLDDAPVVVLIDNNQFIDEWSVQVLYFVVQRMSPDARFTFLCATRRDDPHDIARELLRCIPVPPLTDAASARLLDALPTPPTGRARSRIIEASEGNPMALIAHAGERPGREQVMRQDRWGPAYLDSVAATLSWLPRRTRDLLLRAALSIGDAHATTVSDSLGLAAGAEAWDPAERRTLVSIRGDLVMFQHPLIRTAVIDSATASERRVAHGDLAAVAPAHSLAQLLHLAQAAIGTDEVLARRLESFGAMSLRHNAYYDAARAYEAAAALGDDGRASERCASMAVYCADLFGDDEWVDELGTSRLAIGTMIDVDPLVGRSFARHFSNRWQQRRAQEMIARALGSPSASQGDLLGLLTVAGQLAFESGRDDHRMFVRELLALADAYDWTETTDQPSWPVDAASTTFRFAALAAGTTTVEPAPRVSDEGEPRMLVTHSIQRMMLDAMSSWMQDLPRLASEQFERAFYHLSIEQSGGIMRDAYVPYILSLMDAGEYERAERILGEAADLAVLRRSTRLGFQLACLRTIIVAEKALGDEASAILDDALRESPGIDFSENAFTYLLLLRARTSVALAKDDQETAYLYSRMAFDASGEPKHFLWGARFVLPLASYGSRVGYHRELSAVVDRVRATVGARSTPYVTMLLDYAEAVGAQASDHGEAAEVVDAAFQRAVSSEAAAQWVVAHTMICADYGVWLRRRRRLKEARRMLRTALDGFSRHDMPQPVSWMEAELRAAGATDVAPPPAGVLDDLTSQQQEIVRLAAQGLRNGEIAERMFLSTHTVRSHLYRVFPKLGVTDRQQLRDLFDPGSR